MRSPIFPKGNLTAAPSIASSSLSFMHYSSSSDLAVFSTPASLPLHSPTLTAPTFPHIPPLCPCLNTLSLLLPFLPSKLCSLELLLLPLILSSPVPVFLFAHLSGPHSLLYAFSSFLSASLLPPFNIHGLFSSTSLLKSILTSITSLMV